MCRNRDHKLDYQEPDLIDQIQMIGNYNRNGSYNKIVSIKTTGLKTA